MASAETNKQHSIPRESPAEISLESTDPVTQSATAVDSSDMAALTRAVIRNTTTAEPSDSATPFTQQQSPLLRLPAELRNRIYGEVFRSFFEDLEKRRASTWGEQNPVDPKEIRPLLGGLTVCRQFHQEAMTHLFRDFLARQPSLLVTFGTEMDLGPLLAVSVVLPDREALCATHALQHRASAEPSR
jgi:hypothetical protein